jgi:very-short-patch-repair endonuclease
MEAPSDCPHYFPEPEPANPAASRCGVKPMQNHDSIIIGLAGRQHGIVARWQLTAAGLPPPFIELRIRQLRMQRWHRCVYCLSALAGPRAREVAAVLSCGAHAAASHRDAAVVYALLHPSAGDVSVSVSRGNPRQRPGVRIYRVRLPPSEVTNEDGLPVTTPVRTLLDLAAIVTPRELEQALAQALRQELTTEREVTRVLNRYSRRPGSARLRALLALETPPALTRSEAEERFLALVRRAQLPSPSTNVHVAGFEVDAYWRAEQLVVEVDGLVYHASRRALCRDRRRDAALTAAGVRVMRFTWADLTEQPEATLARLAQALARAPAR